AQTFVTFCLRRAKTLQPYARCDDLDAEALRTLHQDGLIEFNKRTQALGAPAHDVLEDWAILVWINERFAVSQGNRVAFVADLGSFPAIRRGYRSWLGEFLRFDGGNADRFVLDVVGDTSIPNFFKDDTLIAVLLSG